MDISASRYGKGIIKLLPGVCMVIGMVSLLVCQGCTPAEKATPSHGGLSTAIENHVSCPELVFDDAEFEFELRRTLSAVCSGEADMGECLYTASRIKDGDMESWHNEWYATAEHVRKTGNDSLAGGFNVSALESYYRAATYYRTAEFFLHGDVADPRILETWGKSRDTFLKAARLDTIPFEEVQIPYEKTTLPAYFYSVDGPGKQRPLLIVQTGFDGCQEELRPYVLEGLKRGYNVLTFEGPGQGAVIRQQHIPFRSDWENVVSPVIDYAVTRADVDSDRIALWGISLGGYLAPRAAAYDHRIAAVIADGATYDVGYNILRSMKKAGGPMAKISRQELQAYLRTDPAEFNQSIEAAMKTSTRERWLYEHGMFVFDTASAALFLAKWMDFTLEGVSENITCPVLLCFSRADSFDPGGEQAESLYNHLTSEKTMMEFTGEYEAGYHCQMGAWPQAFTRKFNWLDARIK